jgi:hypothetical protein
MMLGSHTFMIRSGLKVPIPAMPMPALAVPNAAPMPVSNQSSVSHV